MRRRALLPLASLTLARGLHAEDAVPELSPPPGARLPADLPVRDAEGHALTTDQALGGLPAVFTFADYGCEVLCGTALGLAAATLPATGLRPGKDYRLVVLGLNPQDGPGMAAARRRAWLGEGTALADTARFLVAGATVIETATRALGYRVLRRADRIDHPLALLILRADGRLATTLPALGTEPEALRTALRQVETTQPPPFARIGLLCQAAGLTAGGTSLQQALTASGAATLALLGGGLVLLRRRERQP
jgi:protein SCO1